MEKIMQIVEVTIFTRPNTSVDWPGANLEFANNSPFKTGLGIDYTQTNTYSNNNLTKTNSKIWNSQEAFVASRVFNDNYVEQWFNYILDNNIVYNKTIEVIS
jgi:hypothetical protein